MSTKYHFAFTINFEPESGIQFRSGMIRLDSEDLVQNMLDDILKVTNLVLGSIPDKLRIGCELGLFEIKGEVQKEIMKSEPMAFDELNFEVFAKEFLTKAYGLAKS